MTEREIISIEEFAEIAEKFGFPKEGQTIEELYAECEKLLETLKHRTFVRGKYGKAEIFTDVVDENALAQVKSLLDQPYIEGSRIRIMPDVHAGAGCTIGTTMTIKNKICPNLVGVDIGCGMETIRIKESHIESIKLDKLIHAEIPSGFDIRETPHRYADEIDLNELFCAKNINHDRALKSIGTLGGGNHFIEADKDDDGNIYIVIHSGSRHLGLEIANYYQDAGYRALTFYSHDEVMKIINKMKANGREKEIENVIKRLTPKETAIPKPLAYVEGELFEQYIHDMKIAQKFAEINRRAMMDVIVKGMKFHVVERFSTIHNYIDTDNMILRKGAVSAQKGEKLLIPVNMCDGSLICTGKGNAEWNFSAPHGAGRLMSRNEAKRTFTVSEFKKQMKGIYTTSVDQTTLDECPMAYKSIDDIIGNIGPTVKIDSIIKPIYNFKAGDEE